MLLVVVISIFLSRSVQQVQSLELVSIQENSQEFLQEIYPPVQIFHIHHVLDSVPQLLSFLAEVPLGLKAHEREGVKGQLFSKAEKSEALGILVLEIALGKENLEEDFSIEFHEDESGKQGIEDTSHVAEGIDDGEVASSIGNFFLGVGENNVELDETTNQIGKTFDVLIEFIAMSGLLSILQGQHGVIRVESVRNHLVEMSLNVVGLVAEPFEVADPWVSVVIRVHC